MSREASLAVAGYFPIPQHLMASVCAYRRRVPGAGQLHIVDTCAGEGAALRAVRDHLGAQVDKLEGDHYEGQARCEHLSSPGVRAAC
jgi:hypothetical protein